MTVQSTVSAPAQARPATTTISTSLFEKETIALGLVLSVALVTHAFNMFNYPLYRQDEGIVSQNAWAFLQNWQLSPYTYAYEHPPLATFMLAIWTLITGGFHTFGSALNSGRVFMLVVHLGSVFFLYRTARQLTGSLGGAIVAGLLFSLSPLAINFQRLLLVDNIMVFWLLAAVYFTVCNKGRLFYFFGACFAMGLAVVTRETAIFFVPAFLFLLVRFSDVYHRLYAVWGGVLLTGVVTVQYLLYAIFKSELVPDNFNFQAELDGTATHVSLLGTLYQNYHGAGAAWDGSTKIWAIWQDWTKADSLFLFGGLISMVVLTVFWFKYKESWVTPLLGLSYGLFLAAGGLDADHMIVAVVPFLALASGQMLGKVLHLVGPMLSMVLVAGAVAAVAYLYVASNTQIYTVDNNQSYRQALDWIKGNIPTNRSMIISDAFWVDLHENYNGPAFPLAHSHWKAAHDPAVRFKVFDGNYKNVDFLVMTAEMTKQFDDKGEELPKQALDNSSLVRQFNGPDALEIRKVKNQKPLIEGSTLDDAYAFYLTHFISPEGMVKDSKGRVSADQQASALQLALWNNDLKNFDIIWTWTAYNLQMDNSLFKAELTSQTPSKNKNAIETYNNTRADTDIALALVLASQRWHNEDYLKEAQHIMKALWDTSVIDVHKKLYLKASATTLAQRDDEVLLNMGAFSPQAYRVFAQVEKDKKHDWKKLYDDGYDLLRKAAWYGRGDYTGVGLPPGLVVMNTDTEELRAVSGEYGARLGDFDEEAQQAMWRVVLDYKWTDSDRELWFDQKATQPDNDAAREFIKSTNWFMISRWDTWHTLAGQYTNNGLPVNNTRNLSSYAITSAGAGALNQIQLEQKPVKGDDQPQGTLGAEVEIISRAFMGSFTRKDGLGYWVKEDDLEAQYWGWMGTALHMNKIDPLFPQAAPVERSDLAQNQGR